MRARAILNPRAGLKSQRAVHALERNPFWKGVEVKVTTAPGDARTWAAEAAAEGLDLVMALGGDGTVNEVASSLLGTSTALALVPVGSGNGLARTLGLSLQPEGALHELETARPRLMDVGTINDVPFLNVAGAGFDAAVGHLFQEQGRQGGRRGIWPYIRIGLREAFSYQALDWTLEADGAAAFQGRAFVIAFLNARQYGAGAVMAPGARLDDGILDIVVLADRPRLEILFNAGRLFTGRIGRFSGYRHIPARAARLRANGPLLHHRDGEPEPAPPEELRIGLKPKALRILVPAHTLARPDGPFSLE